MHHKFMRASYMKHFAKFLAILHHNASFFNFCFIINFGFIKNLLKVLLIIHILLKTRGMQSAMIKTENILPLHYWCPAVSRVWERLLG